MNTLTTELSNYKQHFPHLYTREVTNNSHQGGNVMTTEPKTPTRLSIHDKQLVLENYKNGLNGVEIAATTGLSYGAVIYYIKKVKARNGVAKAEKEIAKANKKASKLNGKSPKGPLNRKAPTPEQIAELRRLNSLGTPHVMIANMVGVSSQTVARYIDPTYRAKSPRKDAPKVSKQMPTPTGSKPLMQEIKDEIRAEIRAELKEQILREMFGK